MSSLSESDMSAQSVATEEQESLDSVFPHHLVHSSGESSSDDSDMESNPLRLPSRLRRAEAILAHRTERVIIVLEQMVDSMNHQAVLRTCESMGIQHVWCIDHGYRKSYTLKGGKKVSGPLTVGTMRWLSIRVFESQSECIAALKEDSRTIWSTYLGEGARPLTREAFSDNEHSKPVLPDRLAIIIGRELDGVSHDFLKISDLHVYLPQFGFVESLNVSVATALVLHTLLDWCPEMRGDLNQVDKNAIRRSWFRRLAPRDMQRDEFESFATVIEQAYDNSNKSDATTKQLQWTQQSTRCNEAIRIPRMAKKLRQKVADRGLRPITLDKFNVDQSNQQ